MLKHLQIRNFAIVPSLDLDIHEGFTAITGETGAGKSILVDALGLLLGDRSDASWVRSGEDRAEFPVKALRYFPAQFEMLLLIFPHGDQSGLVQHDVRGLQHGGRAVLVGNLSC